jgi:hypothetical protein
MKQGLTGLSSNSCPSLRLLLLLSDEEVLVPVTSTSVVSFGASKQGQVLVEVPVILAPTVMPVIHSVSQLPVK